MPAATIVRTEDLPLMLTMQDVQAITGLSRDTVYTLMHRKGFPKVKLGRIYRIPREAFFAWMEREATRGESPRES